VLQSRGPGGQGAVLSRRVTPHSRDGSVVYSTAGTTCGRAILETELSVKEKPSEYFRRAARVQKAEEHRSLRGREDGVDPSFCSRCGPALLYERKRSLHMVNIPRARSSPAVPAVSSATTWPSRSFRIGPTPANRLSPQGLSRYRLRTPEIAETPA
jgi:hypothetical protein